MLVIAPCRILYELLPINNDAQTGPKKKILIMSASYSLTPMIPEDWLMLMGVVYLMLDLYVDESNQIDSRSQERIRSASNHVLNIPLGHVDVYHWNRQI